MDHNISTQTMQPIVLSIWAQVGQMSVMDWRPVHCAPSFCPRLQPPRPQIYPSTLQSIKRLTDNIQIMAGWISPMHQFRWWMKEPLSNVIGSDCSVKPYLCLFNFEKKNPFFSCTAMDRGPLAVRVFKAQNLVVRLCLSSAPNNFISFNFQGLPFYFYLDAKLNAFIH